MDLAPPPNLFGATTRLVAFGLATDIQMREDPPTDVMDPTGATGQYRLFSATNLSVTSLNGRIINVTATPLETDGGWEVLVPTGRASGGGHFQAPPLVPITPLTVNAASGAFAWGVKGRPHMVPAMGMQAVFPRFNENIWHIINGTIDATGNVTFSVSESLFPSVTVFVNGSKRPQFHQGDANRLWIGGNLLP